MTRYISLDDLMDELETPLTFRDRAAMAWWSFKRFVKSIYLMPRKIKWAYQRVTRGFSDRDMWSMDMYLAKQFSRQLTWIVEKGQGVPTSYGTPPNYEDDIEDMAARRNAEYLKYAAVFAQYAENGPALNKGWQEELGGVLDKDLQEALQWFSEHFQEFWD